MDGVMRRRGGVLERLLHGEGDQPVAVRIAQTAPESIAFGACAPSRRAAEAATHALGLHGLGA
jgi:DNA-3-methyladenine glycosylase II